MELLITEDLFNAALPVVLEQDVLLFQYEPFSRGYHVSMEKWTPLIGQSLKGQTETNNQHDKHMVAIAQRNSCNGKEIVGHVLLNISEFLSKVLSLHCCYLDFKVTVKRINLGADYELEINK